MARKTIDFTINEPGRDKGKTFRITEMPASKAEAWAMRALIALMGNGIELPEGFDKSGMAGMAELGLKVLSRLKYADAEPLLAEMMECVTLVPDTSKSAFSRTLHEEDIDEVKTRILIRAEVWKLHTDFLKAAAL